MFAQSKVKTIFLDTYVDEGGRLDLCKKIKGKLNTCVNFHQTQGLSFLSLASSWPPSWKTTTEEFTAGSHG